MVLLIIFVAVEVVYLFYWYVSCSSYDGYHWFWPIEVRRAIWRRRKAEKASRRDGTVRIVEKMDEEGVPYYITEVYTSGCWGIYLSNYNDGFRDYTRFSSVEEAQEAITKEREEDLRREYHKVMGEV